MRLHFRVISLLLATASAAQMSACTKSVETIVKTPGPVVSAGDIPMGTAESLALPTGEAIVVHNIGGTYFNEIEATFSNEKLASLLADTAGLSRAEKNQIVDNAIQKILTGIRRSNGIALRREASVGYFTFLIPYTADDLLGAAAVKDLRKSGDVLFSPVVFDNSSLRQSKQMTPGAEGLELNGSGRDSNDGFSGLAQINAIDFVRQAQRDIGEGSVVNGSSVKLGITDTGITYNHPTFLNRAGTAPRITYLKDFTREGRVYFNPKAKFDVSVPADAPADALTLTAEVILTPKIPSLPAGDKLQKLENLPIKVSPELKAILTTPGNGAKLGLLLEDSISSEDEKADINGNGNLKDKIPMILIPGATVDQDVVYVDWSGKLNFTQSKPLHSFNVNHETTPVYAEKIGFDLMNDELPASDGQNTVKVKSASIVGFDPGNHGSHVAGIAAGIKTIANDQDETLARGVAPEAQILLNRVCSNNAGCNATQAMIDIAQNGHADVVNMSLGGLSIYNDGSGVQETIANRLTSVSNTLFVISAGNSGPGRNTVGSPSTARLSLSVGASASRGMIERQYGWPGYGTSSAENSTAADDFMLFFSSRGPTAAGGFKPNIAAPGTELSSVQLNAAPGSRAGLDVYWGTSMAAPTATGAYALLLDGVKKYNAAHPDMPLSTDAVQLRSVLIESARPFDVSTLDLSTGKKTSGQYTWVDQGTGVINLVAAWNKLFELRDSGTQGGVTADYIVMTSSDQNPNGLAFNGSRLGAEKTPVFGEGLYLDYYGTETLKQVHIGRRLPERLSQSDNAGPLEAQLRTTSDEFVLRTVVHGSDKAWLKAGTLDRLGCAGSPTANLTVLGRGAEVTKAEDGTGTVNAMVASVLNICIDRDAIAKDLPQGDNGALIYAYRKVGGKVSPVASFVVPVYVTVPHKTLAGASAYETQATVSSFGVSRNYVTVPKGASVVRVTLSVPAAKKSASGSAASADQCMGVELMSLEGTNIAKSFPTRAEARIANCDPTGKPYAEDSPKRTLVFTRTNPTPGIWDLHIFGQYKYAKSNYTMRVDYVVADADIEKIEGGAAALRGTFHWTIKDSSLSLQPDQAKSSFSLTGLKSVTASKAVQDSSVVAQGPEGDFRKYSAETESVTIAIGKSPGNDLDLRVVACDASAATAPDPETCAAVGTSGGPTDEEKVTFKPVAGKMYAALVDGYDVKDEGAFESTETIAAGKEQGTVRATGTAPTFTIDYVFSDEQLASSKLLTSTQFTSGKYTLVGDLTIRTSDSVVLDSLPVSIKSQ